MPDRLGPVAVACSGTCGEKVSNGRAGQVTGLPEVVQGLVQVGAVFIVSVGKYAVPADGRVSPAHPGVVTGGLGGGQPGLADRAEVGPVSRPWPPGKKAWQAKICQAWVMKPAAAAWAVAWTRTWCSAWAQSSSPASPAVCSGTTPGAGGAGVNRHGMSDEIMTLVRR